MVVRGRLSNRPRSIQCSVVSGTSAWLEYALVVLGGLRACHLALLVVTVAFGDTEVRVWPISYLLLICASSDSSWQRVGVFNDHWLQPCRDIVDAHRCGLVSVALSASLMSRIWCVGHFLWGSRLRNYRLIVAASIRTWVTSLRNTGATANCHVLGLRTSACVRNRVHLMQNHGITLRINFFPHLRDLILQIRYVVLFFAKYLSKHVVLLAEECLISTQCNLSLMRWSVTMR